MTALIFHDFFLIFLIAGIVMIFKYTGVISSAPTRDRDQRGFGPSDVTGAPIPIPNTNGNAIHDDAL